MATWTTSSSANSDLTGSMEMDGDTVTSYTSTNLGVTDSNPTMLGGTGLNFKVQFTKVTGKSTPPVTTKYHINAHKTDDGKKYKGDSGKDSPEAGQDDWEASSIGPEPKGY